MLKAVRGGRKSRRRLQFEEDGGEDVEHVALRTREYSSFNTAPASSSSASNRIFHRYQRRRLQWPRRTAAEQWLQYHLGIHKGCLGLVGMDMSNHCSMCGCPDDDNSILILSNIQVMLTWKSMFG
ncbi:uncharacterized protein LOC125517263 isoform X2 [Triticum urartu]|uniref:uncharacterized protein LOC125517263 isoform X2 n=1 Tax=Triticum urartu TaxID=4572 RepID=UPI002044318B|nr:uncharacterized protein LOC125517263 isoform X2 [Triticum urartu]